MTSTADHGGPKWPTRLKDLYREVQSARDDASRDKAIGEIWLILNTSISRYLRYHMDRLGRISREDIEDIAAQKSLDLVRRIRLGKWEIGCRETSEITGFVSKVARNGLYDRLLQLGSQVQPVDADQDDWRSDDQVQLSASGIMDSPEVLLERKQFAEALGQCVEHLKPTARLVWFLRVFYGMPSKKIAVHPDVGLKPGHVDVLLQRARHEIRECMRRRGYDSCDMLPGTFGELWNVFRGEKSRRNTG